MDRGLLSLLVLNVIWFSIFTVGLRIFNLITIPVSLIPVSITIVYLYEKHNEKRFPNEVKHE